METTTDFLEAIKKKHGLPSDGRLAAMLGLTRSAVCRFKQKKDFLGNETAMKVAALLDIDAAYVVACVHAERAHGAAEKKMWEGIASVYIMRISGDRRFSDRRHHDLTAAWLVKITDRRHLCDLEHPEDRRHEAAYA